MTLGLNSAAAVPDQAPRAVPDQAPQAVPDLLGMPLFRFMPAGGIVSGPAFSRPFKALALIIVGGCAIWLFNLWRSGHLSSTGSWQSNGLGWTVAAMALLGWTLWAILTSRTSLNSTALLQTWIWDKSVELNDLAYCKLIRVPGLDWLIAPRLYVRTLMGKISVFYAAQGPLLAEFERLSKELSRHRLGQMADAPENNPTP